MRRKRSALVIGNGAYTGPNVTVLKNPKNDAVALSEKLRSYGFEVILVVDADLLELRQALKDYRSVIDPGGVSLVFFAGHGIQINGANYLFACDTDASGEHEAQWSSLSLDQIIDALERSGAETKIIILDACRENPFERAWGRTGAPRGLASVFAPRGTIIAFSTSPGQIAGDGSLDNGVYTGSLLNHIDAIDVPIETIFKSVRNEVAAKSGGKQITWEHTSLAGDFSFRISAGKVVSDYKLSSIADSRLALDPTRKSHQLIRGLKTIDWYQQNPAVDSLDAATANSFNIDSLFLIGRNIYQAANGGARSAESFINNFMTKTRGFKQQKTKALLDGILFEIFFDSKGEIREKIKPNMFNEVFELQKFPSLKSSFDFIAQSLMDTNADFFTVPGKGQTLSASVVTVTQKDGRHLLTGVYVGTVNVFRLLDDEYAPSGNSVVIGRSVEQGDFEAGLSQDLVVPIALLNITYNPPLKRGEKIYYPYGWGIKN